MSSLIEVPADVLRTCLRMTRHSSLWMNEVYRNVHGPAESDVGRACFFVHESVYGAPVRAKHVSLSPRNH